MKKFDRNEGRGFEKRGFGGRDRGGFGGRDSFSERKEMFPTVCSDCGNNCEVPFRPSGSKPVFCSDCFRGHDQAPARDSGRGRDFSPAPRRFEERAPRPSFSAAPKDNNIEDRLTALHVKLDKVIALLNDSSTPKAVIKELKSEPKKSENKSELKEKEVKKEEQAKKVKKEVKKTEPKPKKVAKKVVKKVAKK